MSFPSPLLPVGSGRDAVAAAPAPAAAPSPAAADEGLLQGLTRRSQEFLAALRSRDLAALVILAISCWLGILWALEAAPFSWKIDVDAPEWQWASSSWLGSLVGGAAAIVTVKLGAILLLASLVAVLGLVVAWYRLEAVAAVGISGGLIYSYWEGLKITATCWKDPQYAHAWIVPLLTLGLLVWRRQPAAPVATSARSAGFGLIALSLLVRLGFAFFRVTTFDMYTFVPAVAGLFLLLGGWGVFRWAWIPLVLLIFMYPLPEGHQRFLTGPLQAFNTRVATFILQTLGFDAVRDGNQIRLGQEHVLNVVDACAGLKMLTIFVWLCAVVIVVAGLSWWENLVIAISAIPIAVMANALRITTAGMLYGVSPKWAESFHDSTPAAVLMMGIAVGFILLEIKLLSFVLVADDYTPAAMKPVAQPRPTGAASGGSRGGFPVIPGVNPSPPRPGSSGKMG